MRIVALLLSRLGKVRNLIFIMKISVQLRTIYLLLSIRQYFNFEEILFNILISFIQDSNKSKKRVVSVEGEIRIFLTG